MTEYRIVPDAFAGYEVQARRWWWPFWWQIGINTHSSLGHAKEFALRHATGLQQRTRPRPVYYLGQLPASGMSPGTAEPGTGSGPKDGQPDPPQAGDAQQPPDSPA